MGDPEPLTAHCPWWLNMLWGSEGAGQHMNAPAHDLCFHDYEGSHHIRQDECSV